MNVRTTSSVAKFSIIVPCFNSSATIDDALSSVLSQSWPVEIVIVDGGSTDDTLARIKAYGERIAAFISEPDRGIYDAINKGIPLCSGDLIGILGSDDRYLGGAFASVAALWENEPAEILAGRTRMVNVAGQASIRLDEPYGMGSLISGIPFGHNAMFASPAAYKRVGLYDLRYRICGDANWVHRAILAGLSCRVTTEIILEFGLEGTSSIKKDEIMAETYQAIVQNFSNLSTADAKTLLFAVRKWGPWEPVKDLLLQHQNHELLWRAVEAAVPQAAEAARAAISFPAATVPKLGGLPSSFIRSIIGRAFGS